MIARSSRAKTFAKRWSRRVMAAGGSLLAHLRGQKLSEGVRILTYHRISEDRGDPFAVSPMDFADQMEALAGTGAVRSLEEALKGLEESRARNESWIVLTFDDGTLDFFSAAAPVLTRLNLPATLYVCPSRLASAGFLNWEHLRQVSEAGFEVGSHGLDHQSLGSIPPEEVTCQLQESRKILEDRLGHAVTSLAYPYGTLRDFNESVKSRVHWAGYRSACTSINGVNRDGADLLALRRTKIEHGDQPIYRRILRGGLDGWAFVDHHLNIFQGRYG